MSDTSSTSPTRGTDQKPENVRTSTDSALEDADRLSLAGADPVDALKTMLATPPLKN